MRPIQIHIEYVLCIHLIYFYFCFFNLVIRSELVNTNAIVFFLVGAFSIRCDVLGVLDFRKRITRVLPTRVKLLHVAEHETQLQIIGHTILHRGFDLEIV